MADSLLDQMRTGLEGFMEETRSSPRRRKIKAAMKNILVWCFDDEHIQKVLMHKRVKCNHLLVKMWESFSTPQFFFGAFPSLINSVLSNITPWINSNNYLHCLRHYSLWHFIKIKMHGQRSLNEVLGSFVLFLISPVSISEVVFGICDPLN